MLGQKPKAVLGVARVPHRLGRARTEARDGDPDLGEDVRLDVEALCLTRLAKVKVGAVGTAVADAADRVDAAAVALAASVDVGIAAGIVFGDAEEQADDVLTGALLLAAKLVVAVVVPVVLKHVLVGDRLGVVQGSDRVHFDVFVGVGLDRRGGGLGRLAGVAADGIRKRAPTMADGIASVEATVGCGLGERRVVDAVAEVAQGCGCSKRQDGKADALPGQRRGCGG